MKKVGSNYPGLAFPKSPPKRSEKRKQKALDGEWVRGIRQSVVTRDGGCRVCGTRSTSLHLHEIVYRSKTRGLPMAQRVNMVNCVLLCEVHHAEIHAHRLEVVIVDPTEGANGRLEFKPRT